MPTKHLISDRAYFPGQQEDRFQRPARQRGYQHVGDYRIDQLGMQDQYAGAIRVEGTFYCPSMPQSLIDASKEHLAGTIDESIYALRIEERRRYALRDKEKPDANGNQPKMCPAVGHGATAACPLKADSMRGPNIAVRVQITRPPEHPDRICTNTTSVSFPLTAGAKYGQRYAYGSPEWQANYSLRNTVESYNGYVKDPNYEALGDAGRRRISGLPAQYMLTSILIAAANIRKIRTWLLTYPINKKVAQRRHDQRHDARRSAATVDAPTANSPPSA